MTHSQGYRSGTRKKFSKGFRKHGAVHIKNYLTTFHNGDYVDIVVDSAIHKGMPHQIYHGTTARVFNVNPRAIGVVIHKTVRERKIEKRLHIRPEHLRLSSCRADFLKRVQVNDKLKAAASKAGKRISTKRVPKGSEPAHIVKVDLKAVEGRNVKPYIKIY